MATPLGTHSEESFIPATKEYEVLKGNASILQRVITDQKLLSMDLFSVNLISSYTLHKVNAAVTTPDAQSYELINNLLQAVVCDPNNFHKLLQVLEKHPPLLTVVAKEMKEEYESTTDIFQVQPRRVRKSIPNDEKKTLINVGPRVQRDYEEMRWKLAGLVQDFQKAAEAANVNIDDLKQFIMLYGHDKECVKQLKEAKNLSEVFAVVRDRLCSLFNYVVLLRIAEKFNIADAFKVIQSYEIEEENYRRILTSSTLAEELRRETKQLSCHPSTAQNTIILKLRWSPPLETPTVSDFESVIKEVFFELYSYIHLLKVEPGSIIATMCAPERVVGALIALAKKRIVYLTDIGVTWLMIGDDTIISINEDTTELSSQEQDTELSFITFNMAKIKLSSDNQPSNQPVGVVTATRSHTLEAVTDDAGDDADQGQSDSATPIFNPTWRHYPPEPRELMIIGSYGDHDYWEQQQHIVSSKLLPAAGGLSEEWKREEIEQIVELYKRDPEYYHIQSVCCDLAGEEYTKSYYLEKIKMLFINCQQPGAIIYYTGHGEKDTGNWCFKDGVITFNDIFDLYVTHFKGKPLNIISDCSYSGNWINDCAKRLDEMNVPSCGHHTRKHGLLFQIYTSCQLSEEATALCYMNEAAMYSEADKAVLFWTNKTLMSGQKTMHTDFKDIRCSKPADESCEADSDCTWNDRLIKSRLVYLVRGKNKGRPAWHYVLVDEEKLDDFKARVATETINVADYGRKLKSGWGKDPFKYTAHKINLRYSDFVDPI